MLRIRPTEGGVWPEITGAELAAFAKHHSTLPTPRQIRTRAASVHRESESYLDSAGLGVMTFTTSSITALLISIK